MSVEIKAKMRQANIPVYAEKTTLPKLGQQALRALIERREFMTEDGLNNYIVHAGDRMYGIEVAEVVALMAKELVLSGVPTYHVTVTSLAKELEREDVVRAEESSVSNALARSGKGYICIPDFEDIEHIDAGLWRYTLDWLMQHVRRGGGLVLGQAIYVAAIPSVYGPSFAAFARSLQEIRINTK